MPEPRLVSECPSTSLNASATIGIGVELHLVESELADVLTIPETGSGTRRQRRLVERGGTLVDVVHHLAQELDDDCLRP